MFKQLKITTLTTILLGLIGLSIAYRIHQEHKKFFSASSPIEVKLSPVMLADIPDTLTSIGTLIPYQQTDISPKASGYITHIFFHEGDDVKAGTVLITLDHAQQKADLDAARADAISNTLKYQRYFILSKKGLYAPQNLETLLTAKKKSDAILNLKKKYFDNMTLKSPFSGCVGEKNISIGDFVTAGKPVLQLVDTRHLKINYALPSRYTPLIKIGQAMTFTADCMPGERFKAKVTYIAPTVDSNTQTVVVHALFNNAQHLLKPGQSINVSHTLGISHNRLLIPENSLIPSINGYSVYEVIQNKVVSIPVKVGQHLYGKVQILKGLNPHDRIITLGQNQVKAGDIVHIISLNI